MNSKENSTGTPGDATTTAAEVFRQVCDLERDVQAAIDLFTAISFIAEALNDDDASGPIMHLCRLGKYDLDAVEQVREQIFHSTHRFRRQETRTVTP